MVLAKTTPQVLRNQVHLFVFCENHCPRNCTVADIKNKQTTQQHQ